MTGIESLFNKMGSEVQSHLNDQHKEINDRLDALETEARAANAQREELQKRLTTAESTSRKADSIPSRSDPCVQGAKLNIVYDQESGKISFQDWSNKL